MKIILASQSPRRKSLLQAMGHDFIVSPTHCDEGFNGIKNDKVAEHLAVRKAMAYNVGENELVIAADTTVLLDDAILNKPASRKEAIEMLTSLSNRMHFVVTGVALRTKTTNSSFSEKTEVHFATLSHEDITYYIDTYKPYDKAGSYGIQEWIGEKRVEKIVGSFNNVVGLPTETLSKELLKFGISSLPG